VQAQNANVSKTASIQKQFVCSFKFASSVFFGTGQATNKVETNRKEKKLI
jgi:hypothetical protein